MSGPSHGSPVGDSLWKRTTSREHRRARRRAATSRAARPRTDRPRRGCAPGSECAVKTTCAVACRERDRRAARRTRSSCPSARRTGARRARASASSSCSPVPLDRQRRVVRREHEPDDRPGARRERALRRLGDPRRPVRMPGEDRQAELRLERRPRPLGDLVERLRLLDAERAVALDEVVEVLGRDRPAAADVGVVGGDVLEALGRAVRHQDDRGLMPPPSRPPLVDELSEPRQRRPGRSPGRTPWPRLKMCPGRPPARAEHVARRRSTRSHGPSSTAGSRLPWTPRSCPTSSQPRSSGMRQSRPITSPPGGGHRASSVAVPVPKWIVGHVDRGEDPRRVRRDELVVVGGREGADPGVEELDHVRAGLDLGGDVARRTLREPLHQRVPGVGLAVHQRLRRVANSRLGLPSTR